VSAQLVVGLQLHFVIFRVVVRAAEPAQCESAGAGEHPVPAAPGRTCRGFSPACSGRWGSASACPTPPIRIGPGGAKAGRRPCWCPKCRWAGAVQKAPGHEAVVFALAEVPSKVKDLWDSLKPVSKASSTGLSRWQRHGRAHKPRRIGSGRRCLHPAAVQGELRLAESVPHVAPPPTLPKVPPVTLTEFGRSSAPA